MDTPTLQRPLDNSAQKRGSQSNRTRIDLSIICVNWNSADFLRECIVSIYETVTDLSYEIIVVDNASPDGGADALLEEFPEIKLIHSAVNLGFAGANNLGFKYSTGSFVLFLNPDTRVLDTAIPTMLHRIQSLPDGGVIGCKLLNTDLSIQTSCIQTFPTILNQLLDLDFLRRLTPSLRMWGTAPLFQNPTKPVEVEVVSGACMMLRREVFSDIGLFSTDYFMYAEDLDLCYKAHQRGFSNYYIPDATIVHHGQKSSGKQGNRVRSVEWAIVMRCDSVLRFCVRNRGKFYASLYRMTMAVSASLRVLTVAVPALISRTMDAKSSHRGLTLAKWSAVLAWSLGLRKRPIVSSK